MRHEYNDLKDEVEQENYSRKRSISNESEDDYNQKNRNIKKRRNNYDNYHESKKENRRIRDDDFIDYENRPRPRHDRDIVKSKKTHLLEQDYISEEDKIIINADYPERLLMRFKLEELPTLSQEIKPELEWIYE